MAEKPPGTAHGTEEAPRQAESLRDQPRRYQKPRILYREPLEAIAAVCDPVTGKQPGQQFPCSSVQGS